MNKDQVFVGFITPWVSSRETAGFSVTFELNDQHPAFNGLNVGYWKQLVSEYHNRLPSKGLRVIIKDSQGVVNKQIEATIVHDTAVPFEKELWAKFLGFTYENDKCIPRRKATTGDLNTVVHKVELQSFDLNMEEQLGFDGVIDEVRATGSIEDRPQRVGAALDRIAGLAGTGLSKNMKNGLAEASDINKLSNRRRRGEIENSSFYNNQLSVHKKVARSVPALKEVGEKLRQHFAEISALNDVVINEPEFIKQALDQLNEHLTVRQAVKTMLSFTFPMSELNGINDFTISLDPTVIDDTYFDASQITRCRIPTFSNRDLIVCGWTDYDGSIMNIGTNCRILSYESESVSQNATDTLSKITSLKRSKLDNLNSTFRAQEKKELGGRFKEHVDRQMDALSVAKRVREINNQVKSITSKGQSVFYVPVKADSEPDKNDIVPTQDLISGYIVYARRVGMNERWTCLCRTRESFLKNSGKKVLVHLPNLLGIRTGVGMETTTNELDQPSSKVKIANNNFLFNWDGTMVSTMNPMQHYESQPKDIEADELENVRDDQTLEMQAVNSNGKKIFGVDWFPFKKNEIDKLPEYLLRRQYDYDTEQRLQLKFGDKYEYVLLAQYQNGFVPLKNVIENLTQFQLVSNEINQRKTRPSHEEQHLFPRYDHIKNIEVRLDEDLYENNDTSKLKRDKLGESVLDLVVRTGKSVENNQSVRYILPPPVPNFQVYLWYNRKDTLKDQNLSPEASAHWFQKYQCEVGDHEAFEKNKKNSHSSPNCGCRKGCVSYCGGTKQPRVYGGELNYLADPIVTGFAFRLYADPERERPVLFDFNGSRVEEAWCKYAKGNYPELQPWKLVLERSSVSNESLPRVTTKDSSQKLTIQLRAGQQFWASLIPTFLNSLTSRLHPPHINVWGPPFTPDLSRPYFYHTLLANITNITLTHASETPVVKPVIEKVVVNRFSKQYPGLNEDLVKIEVTLLIEQLHLWEGLPVKGLIPTGELELFGVWDDYTNNGVAPQTTMAARARKGFICIGSVRFNELIKTPMSLDPNDDNCICRSLIIFDSEVGLSINQTTDAILKIRNVSKFAAYFPKEKSTVDDKAQFSLWSDNWIMNVPEKDAVMIWRPLDAEAPYFFNNRKPMPVEVLKIDPLKVRDVSKNSIEEHGNRIRIYFNPKQMMQTGKDYRVGVVVEDKDCLYFDLFGNGGRISRGGIDALMVNPSNRLALSSSNHLDQSHFVLDHDKLESIYVTRFDPRNEMLVAHPNRMMLVSYKPARDNNTGEWFIDVELNLKMSDGKSVRTAMVQLNLVTFERHSANYNTFNDQTQSGYDSDYRLSEPVPVDFVSIYPSREFHNHWILLNKGGKNFRFSPEGTSLRFLKNDNLATQFYLFVEKEKNGYWFRIESKLYNEGIQDKFRVYHPLLDLNIHEYNEIFCEFTLNYDDSGKNRIVIMEVDCINDDMTAADLAAKIEQLKFDRPESEFDFTHIPGVWLKNTTIIDKSTIIEL